jgi:phosphate transport system substrate-binding protein
VERTRGERARIGLRWGGVGLLWGLFVLCLAGCDTLTLGGAAHALPSPTPVPPSYSGTITCVGSSILAPILAQASMSFEQAYPLAHILVITTTSQAGLSAVQDGGADLGLSDASASTFSGLDVQQLYDHAVAGGVFAMIVHPGIGLTGLTSDQVRQIYTGKITNWRELGGPNLPIVVVTRPKGAGVRAIFRQFVLDGAPENDDVATPQETNQDVAARVQSQAGAIGYVSSSAVQPGMQVLALDGVMPDSAAVRLGQYRFWSVEHLYTKGPAGGLAAAFISYLLTADAQIELFRSQGFIPAADLPLKSNP